MTAWARYALLALLVVAVTVVVGMRLVAEQDQTAVWVGLLAAIVVQGPMGWWVIGSIGSRRFVVTWGLSLLARLALIALLAFVVVPAAGLSATPLLITAVSVLAALLLVEGTVALLELSRTTI
jgi:hypothetical protein